MALLGTYLRRGCCRHVLYAAGFAAAACRSLYGLFMDSELVNTTVRKSGCARLCAVTRGCCHHGGPLWLDCWEARR